MRIAALYDVHGNLPALEAVLAELANEGVDEIVAGGDVLGVLDVGFPGFAEQFPATLRGERTADEAMRWFEGRRGA